MDAGASPETLVQPRTYRVPEDHLPVVPGRASGGQKQLQVAEVQNLVGPVGSAAGHLEDPSAAWVQDPKTPVLGGRGQPAAVSTEADGQQQRLGRVALVDGPQQHPDRTPEKGARLGHVPQEHLGGRDRSGVDARSWTWEGGGVRPTRPQTRSGTL